MPFRRSSPLCSSPSQRRCEPRLRGEQPGDALEIERRHGGIVTTPLSLALLSIHVVPASDPVDLVAPSLRKESGRRHNTTVRRSISSVARLLAREDVVASSCRREEHKDWSALNASLMHCSSNDAGPIPWLIALGRGNRGSGGNSRRQPISAACPSSRFLPRCSHKWIRPSRKTAINHPLGKNMIGAFHSASAGRRRHDNAGDPARARAALGLAEVIKHA